MGAGNIASSCLLMLGVVLAIPSQLAATIVDKRQVGVGDYSGNNFSRPADWDTLPDLPWYLERAYERGARLNAYAFLTAEFVDDPVVNVGLVASILEGFMTYLKPERIREIVTRASKDILEGERAGVSRSRQLENYSAGDPYLMESQMTRIVYFRQQNEHIGSPGQEDWRYPYLRVEGQPKGLPSPFYSLSENLDRLLIIAKARGSEKVSRQELLYYLLIHDPFLEGYESYAMDLISDTLKRFNIIQDRNSMMNWFLDLFGLNDS